MHTIQAMRYIKDADCFGQGINKLDKNQRLRKGRRAWGGAPEYFEGGLEFPLALLKIVILVATKHNIFLGKGKPPVDTGSSIKSA